MEQFGLELQDRRLVGVLFIEVDLQAESATFPDCVQRPKYYRLPLVQVIFIGHCIDTFNVALFNLLQVLQQSPLSCG